MNKKIAVIFTLLLSASPMLMASSTYELPEDFNSTQYLGLNPDVRHLAEEVHISEPKTLSNFARGHYSKTGKAQGKSYSISDKTAEISKKMESIEKNPSRTVESVHKIGDEVMALVDAKDYARKVLTMEQKKAVEKLEERANDLVFNTPGAMPS